MAASTGYITMEDGIGLYFQTVGSGGQIAFIPNGIYLFDVFKRFAEGRTLIFYDVRNRGRSDAVTDSAKLARGILQDVDDLETVRRHFGVDQVDLIGHSYVGLTVALYAMKYPEHVRRVVQIGPMPPYAGKQYPAHLMYADATTSEVFGKLAQMRKDGISGDREEICRKVYSVLRLLVVIDPADAEKVDWGRCELPNESGFMTYWMGTILPSIQKLQFPAEEFAKVKAPVLIVHGTKDRNTPYGGARDWALLWPDARLVTVENAAHAPWIEGGNAVLDGIGSFLDGTWPETARRVTAL